MWKPTSQKTERADAKDEYEDILFPEKPAYTTSCAIEIAACLQQQEHL